MVDSDGPNGVLFEIVAAYGPAPSPERSALFAPGGQISSHGSTTQPGGQAVSLIWTLGADAEQTLWHNSDPTLPRFARLEVGAALGAGTMRTPAMRSGNGYRSEATALGASAHAGLDIGQIERAGTPGWFGLFLGGGVEVSTVTSDEATDLQLGLYVQLTIINPHFL